MTYHYSKRNDALKLLRGAIRKLELGMNVEAEFCASDALDLIRELQGE